MGFNKNLKKVGYATALTVMEIAALEQNRRIFAVERARDDVRKARQALAAAEIEYARALRAL